MNPFTVPVGVMSEIRTVGLSSELAMGEEAEHGPRSHDTHILDVSFIS